MSSPTHSPGNPPREVILSPVDGIRITVLVDNYTDLLRRDNSPVIERPDLPERVILLAEHGLALLVTIRSGEEKTTVLLDTGGSDIALRHNAARLNRNLDTISAVIISHGHDDHLGGLEDLLRNVTGPLPVYIHPVAFSQREKWFPDGTSIPVTPPDRNQLINAGARFYLTTRPILLASERILVTGEVERTTAFEQIPPQYYIEDDGTWTHDPFRDDQAVIINLAGKGLVVITGCAHSGVINTIRYASRLTGITRVHAVIGGFHLSGSFFRPLIAPTLNAMDEIDPGYLVPMHCSGWEAMTAAENRMPGRFLLSTVGTSFRF